MSDRTLDLARELLASAEAKQRTAALGVVEGLRLDDLADELRRFLWLADHDAASGGAA